MSGFEIKYGTALHQSILEALLARIDMSLNDMVKYEKRWDDAEKSFAAEIDEKSADALRRTARDSGEPQYTTINVPYSYSMLMTAHTYLSSAFLSRNPILQFQGRHGEPENNVMAVEAYMDYQTTVGLHQPVYYVWLHDALKYGLGITCNYWDKEEYAVTEINEEPVMLLGQPIEGKTQTVKTTKIFTGYEGNRLFNVRPADYIPDTRVPLSNPQNGEFCGRKVDITWNTIIKKKVSGQYFNVDEIQKRVKGPNSGTQERRASIVSDLDIPSQPGIVSHSKTSLVATLPGIELVVELIPTEWGLGSKENPEKWVFTLIDRKIIAEARPLGMWHNKFPFNVIEGEIEGYATVKRGMMQIAQPLNDVMTWLFNSHFYSVRKSINGDVVYDPSRVVASDLLNSDGTGSRIKVRPIAYGQDVRSMIHILQGGADVTGKHLQDTYVVGEMLQRVLGVSDNAMGATNPGGRKTATEVRSSNSGAINRMKTMSEFISASGFAPLTQMLLQTSQQKYSGEKKFRIAGDTVGNAATFLQVNPDDIAGFYDYVPVDGTLPIDRFALVNMWSSLLGQLRAYPQIAMEYDMSRIFAWVAQLAGIKNIKQFKINVVPDGMMGNGVPLGGQSNVGTGNSGTEPSRPTARTGGPGPVVPLPRQIGGVGPSG